MISVSWCTAIYWKGRNKFCKIILSTARSVALRSAQSAKSLSQKIPRVPRMRKTTRDTRARATRYKWKKVPNGIVELWLWWYWREFRGKSGHRLVAGRCHSCESPKTRQILLGTTYIFSCTHTRACASWCFQFYYSNALTGANWWLRGPIKRKWFLFLLLARYMTHVTLVPDNLTWEGLPGRLISIQRDSLLVSGLSSP